MVEQQEWLNSLDLNREKRGLKENTNLYIYGITKKWTNKPLHPVVKCTWNVNIYKIVDGVKTGIQIHSPYSKKLLYRFIETNSSCLILTILNF